MASNPLPGYDAWKLAGPSEPRESHSAKCKRWNRHPDGDPDCICGFEEQQEAEEPRDAKD